MNKIKTYTPPVLIGMVVPSAIKLVASLVGVKLGLLPATAITLLVYAIYLWLKVKQREKKEEEGFQKKLIELRIETDNRLSSMDKSIYQAGNFIEESNKLTMDEVESAWRKKEIAELKNTIRNK